MASDKVKFNTFSNLLILIGSILLLIFIVFQVATYPWKAMLAKWGLIEMPRDLPDPAPLSETGPVQVEYAEDIVLTAEDSEPPGLFASRPAITVTWIGIIKVPSIQVSENIVEGSGDELYYGVGHVIGTPLPGQEGNCILAGHRSYIYMRPFRYLDKVSTGDLVYVSDTQNSYAYEVYELFECGPDDTWVMQPVEDEPYTLTLLTCTPVMIHSDRLIARCRLVGTTPL